VKVELWFGSRLGLASLRTILSHVNNMMVGVTKGYLFKMKYVYAHFPINLVVSSDNKIVEVKNYLVSGIDTHTTSVQMRRKQWGRNDRVRLPCC
jgi:ribosomal protein L6P/L9E